MNFCVNCKHLRLSEMVKGDLTFARCGRKPNYDPVSGELNLPFCSTERFAHNPCGPDGRHFQDARTPDFRDFQSTPPDSVGGDLTTFGSKLEQGA